MNHINAPLVTPDRIAKALRIGRAGSVYRLARFVGVRSVNPWKVFEACQQQRLAALTVKDASEDNKLAK